MYFAVYLDVVVKKEKGICYDKSTYWGNTAALLYIGGIYLDPVGSPFPYFTSSLDRVVKKEL